MRRIDDDHLFYEQLAEWEATADERAADIGEMSRTKFDEARVRASLHPHTGTVAVQRRCECGAIETGVPHEGHRYVCPRHSRHPGSLAA